ncbi:DoxX family protein [Halorarum halophilum]|uniref:DoxX family protein n=1 Tax=Halorarum halophilum TaxID=2743090 RepID=A0A7D5GLQ8_9EURY|nr:DoxX family protein [Halobaculum halophilum]QLG28207.1 DoxX family protein [Halobaculum halophilum]
MSSTTTPRNPANDRSTSIGLLLLRVALGVVFVVTGVGKVFQVGPDAVPVAALAGLISGLGFPAPTALAWFVSLLEMVGGALLLFGFLTRFVAGLLAVDMAVATFLYHLPNGFAVADGGYEYTFVLLCATAALVFTGPGRYSLSYGVLGGELLPVGGDSSRSHS